MPSSDPSISESSSEAHDGHYEEEESKRHYAMLETLGEGAMGEVLLAKDKDLLRKVAFKKILPSFAENKVALQAFLTEAQITAQLEHPSIVPVYGLEVNPKGEIAYSMKLVQGETFKELLEVARQQYQQQGQSDEEHTLSAFLEHFLKVCDAIHYAHEKGILHRDLKPANMMLGPYNEVYVMDWGISRVMSSVKTEDDSEEIIELPISSEDFDKTEHGRVIGTPRYMSPEQAAGKNKVLDGRSDLFSLGVILFELMTLKQAFQGKRITELIKKILTVDMLPMEPYHPQRPVPRELKAIVKKACARKRDERYESVEAFADDIRRFLRGESVLAQPDTWLQSRLRWMGQHKEITAMVTMGLILITSMGFVYNIYRHQQAMVQAHQHERQLNQFLQAVIEKSQAVNNHFLYMESLLESLGSLSKVLIQQNHPSSGPVYTVAKAEKLAEMKYSERFHGEISSAHWIAKIAHGMKFEAAEVDLRKIAPLHDFFPTLFIKSKYKNQNKNLSKDEINTLISDPKTPLLWAYVGFESGGYALYPGTYDFPENYNHRLRPWYVEAKNKGHKTWVTPFVGTAGSGLLMSCEMPLYDAQSKLLGVAGIDMSFDYVKDQFLVSQSPAVRAIYLLDEQGKIILSSKDKQDFENITNQIKKRPTFHNTEVVQAIQAKKSGYLMQDKTLITYYKVEALNWYYVVEGPEAEILKYIDS